MRLVSFLLVLIVVFLFFTSKSQAQIETPALPFENEDFIQTIEGFITPGGVPNVFKGVDSVLNIDIGQSFLDRFTKGFKIKEWDSASKFFDKIRGVWSGINGWMMSNMGIDLVKILKIVGSVAITVLEFITGLLRKIIR